MDDAANDAGRMAKQALAGRDRVPQGREQYLTRKYGKKRILLTIEWCDAGDKT